MIISASRRTDIPSFYSDWFFDRIKKGFVLVRNPRNFHQVRSISLKREVVDGIVFWTKNPIPMLERINEISDYMYYFQFTITPYGEDIEPNIPGKANDIIDAFKRIADIVGPERVIWRYDPIFISNKYSYNYHINAFGKITRELKNYTRKVTFSFIDTDYRGVKANLKELALQDIKPELQIKMSLQLAEIAKDNGLRIDTCAEQLNLGQYGIEHASCIDGALFKKLLDCELHIDKDKNQRLECGCITSIDIGMYNSCQNFCRYCYANYDVGKVDRNFTQHDISSPFLIGDTNVNDKISMCELKSCRDMQISFF